MKRDFLFKSIRCLGKRGCLRGRGSGWHLRNGELTGAAGPAASRETVQMFIRRPGGGHSHVGTPGSSLTEPSCSPAGGSSEEAAGQRSRRKLPGELALFTFEEYICIRVHFSTFASLLPEATVQSKQQKLVLSVFSMRRCEAKG